MKTRFTSILTKAAMMLLLMMLTATTAWAATVQFPIYSGDEGTSEKPYQIKTIDDLNKLAQDVNSGTNYLNKYFKLMNDLDFYEATNTALRPTTAWDDESSTENNYTAIGLYGKSFSGHFDGNNKTIRGLRIYTDNHYLGLFGNIANSAVVENITLTDARLAGGYYIGGIVGDNTSGTVTNCHVRDDVAIVAKNSGNCKGYGGIAGSNTGTVSYCTSAVKIAVADGANAASIGGIAGANTSSATLTDNFVVGAVIPAARYNTHAAIAVDENYTSAPYLVSYERNYYWDCTVAGTPNATDVGIATYMGEKNVPLRDISDNDGAVSKPVYTLTLAAGITAEPTPTIVVSGKPYYSPGTTVTLSGRQSAPELPAVSIYDGYIVNSTAISGNTFEMPAEDVTVNSNIIQCHTLTLAAGITATATPTITVSGTPYYKPGTTVTLSGRPTADGFVYPYLLNGTPFGGDTFAMPASDVTVTVGERVADWQSVYEGSEGNPYQIKTTVDLDLLAQRVNSGNRYVEKYFKLMNDIAYAHTTAWNDATSTENNYTAIGNNANHFGGTFDGDGHTISGIRIYKGGSDESINSAIDCYQGLFGHVGGTVKNVTLTDARITGFQKVGGIVGNNKYSTSVGCYGTVTGCRVAGDVALHAVQNAAASFGGIVGFNSEGTVSGCTSAVKITVASGITGFRYFGGIVGYNFCVKMNDTFVGTITGCHAVGANVAASSVSGALVGEYNVHENSDNPLNGSGNTYHSCLVGSKAFNIGVGNRDDVSGDMTGATLDNTAFLLDDYMDAPALIAAYADPGSHTDNSGTKPNVSSLTATLSRTFPAGKKQTVCLPFPPNALLNLGTVWEFTGIENGKAVMTQRTSGLQAHTPYIFEATAEVKNPTFSDVKVTNDTDPKTVDGTAGFTFHGTYEQKHWLATSDEVTQGTIYGFMAEDNDGQATGQFVRARRETFLRPFSCYLEYNGVLTDTDPTSQAPSLRAGEALPDVIDIVWQPAVGSTTGVRPPSISPNGENTEASPWGGLVGVFWYDLSGKLEQQPTAKGVYIHGGRKVVIK